MRRLLLLIIIIMIATPVPTLAQDDFWGQENNNTDESFEAEVLQILETKEAVREDGAKFQQQNVKLRGLEGAWTDKEFNFIGIGEIEVVSSNEYRKGDKVIVSAIGEKGAEQFYIIDYIRRSNIYWLVGIFCLMIILIGKWKGLKALLSLILSFVIIMKFIIPQVMAGHNPLLISILGALLILVILIYVTEGINSRAHIAIVSILISLLITGILSLVFTSLARLTGTAQEEIMYLIRLGQGVINFKGLLLAGVIIGTLGVLDDVVISQVVAVEQIKKANLRLSNSEVYKKAFEIGKSHLGSMVNTLFLAYAGASLPLLILFNLHREPFEKFSQVINNEVIATEIVRTFVGSIGLAMAVVISTYFASYYLKIKEKETTQ